MNFKGAKNKAQNVARNRERLMALLKSVLVKLQHTEDRHEMIDKAKTKLYTFVRMLKAYTKGEYRDIPWKAILLITAGLIYFVNPLDVVPDFLPVVGLLDDAAIILFIFSNINKEIEEFSKWESEFSENPE